MISKKMENMVANSSAIRAMFEEGNRLAKIYGAENVFDFSLGNPNVPAPEAVKKAIIDLLDEEDPVVLHGDQVGVSQNVQIGHDESLLSACGGWVGQRYSLRYCV